MNDSTPTPPKGSKLIEADQAHLLETQRETLERLQEVASAVAPDSADAHQVAKLLSHLEDFFLLVVVGEVKSGKSAFINAIIEETVCAEGPTPVTDKIWILKHGQERIERVLEEFVIEKQLPLDILRSINVVDTPGTNSIVKRHQEVTEDFIPRADLILFVTSIDRPYSESEHKFLSFISQKWRKKVVFVITKIDTRTPEDLQEVVGFVRENCLKFHGFEPMIFPVSAKGNPPASTNNLGNPVGVDKVQEFIRESLSEGDKAKIKFTSSANATESIVESLESQLTERTNILGRDFEVVTDLEKQVKQSGKELKERYHVYINRIYDALRDFERRGSNFFDDIIRVKNFNILRDRDAFREKFEKKAVGTLKNDIEDIMSEGVDWLIKEQLALYEKALDFLTNRLNLDQYEERVVGKPERGFEYNREQVFGKVRTEFRHQIEQFDISGECHRVLDAANRGILQQLGIQAGAFGVGAILVAVLSATWMDVTGIAFSVGLFLTGFAVLPRVRRQAQSRFAKRVDDLTDRFRTSISAEFDREIDHRGLEIEKCYEPYTRFYRAETEQIQDAQKALGEIRVSLASMRRVIDQNPTTSQD